MPDVEKANFDIVFEPTDKVRITLDDEYKGKIKIPVEINGQQGEIKIPIELEKADIDNFKRLGFEVFEHTGLIIDFGKPA